MTETLCGDLGAHIDARSSRVITYIGLLCPCFIFANDTLDGIAYPRAYLMQIRYNSPFFEE